MLDSHNYNEIQIQISLCVCVYMYVYVTCIWLKGTVLRIPCGSLSCEYLSKRTENWRGNQLTSARLYNIHYNGRFLEEKLYSF